MEPKKDQAGSDASSAVDEVTAMSTGDEQVLELGRTWLQRCLTEHVTCQKTRQVDPPTRLLDLRAHHGSNRIRLCTSIDSCLDGRYATLSHCWGKLYAAGSKGPIKLTALSETELRAGVPFEMLPKTFQHAITVCRRLGVEFIWIDALCILQDCDNLEAKRVAVDDWSREAAKMGAVYRGGVFNVAATCSSDGTQGCFRDRSPSLCRLHEVDVTWTGAPIGRFKLHPQHIWDQEVINTPLIIRGWVTQERLLSPRVLHFGQSQLAWECQEMEACEMYQQGLPPFLKTSIMFDTHIKERLGHLIRDHHSGEGSDQGQRALELWSAIVRDYCRTLLTFENDKLIAIAGLARQLSEIIKAPYYAGHWNIEVHNQLLWYADYGTKSENPLVLPKQYRAPSWSWASMKGRINPNAIYNTLGLVEILSLTVEPAENVWGIVTGGSMRLRGRLRVGELKRKRMSWLQRLIGTVDAAEMMKFEMTIGQNTFEPMVFGDGLIVEAGSTEVFHYLPIRERKDYDWLEGLILEPTDQVGTFRRRGMFMASNMMCKGNKEAIFYGPRIYDDRLQYESLEGEYEYTLTII